MHDDMPQKAVKKATNALAELAEDSGALFTPNRGQRAIKARFWTILSNSMTSKNPLEMSTVEVMRTVRDNRLGAWINIPGFKDWFFNSTEHIERLEYLFDLALIAAEEILLSDDPKSANAKVQMIRVIAELAKKMPQKGGDNFQDEKISRMSKHELEEFLKSQGVSVRQETVLNVTAEKFKTPTVLEIDVDADYSKESDETEVGPGYGTLSNDKQSEE